MESKVDDAKQKAQAAAISRLFDSMQTDAIAYKKIAEQRREKNQMFDQQQQEFVKQRIARCKQLQSYQKIQMLVRQKRD